MEDNHRWTIRVLEKLRMLIINGNSYAFKYGLWWEYDNNKEPDPGECAALLFLLSTGTINGSLGRDVREHPNISLNEQLDEAEPEWNNQQKIKFAIEQASRGVLVFGFDSDKYEKVCEDNNLKAYNESYIVKLSIKYSVPEIETPLKNYSLPTLRQGAVTDILMHCYKNSGQQITIQAMRDSGINIPKNNLRQLFVSGYLSYKAGAIAPFMRVGKTNITLFNEAIISKEQLELIKSQAVKNK